MVLPAVNEPLILYHHISYHRKLPLLIFDNSPNTSNCPPDYYHVGRVGAVCDALIDNVHVVILVKHMPQVHKISGSVDCVVLLVFLIDNYHVL